MPHVPADRLPGRTTVTLRDVAAMAGVHPATASRALNADTRDLVNGETAERVLAAARGRGSRPTPTPRALKPTPPSTIGVVAPALPTPISPPIARGIEDRLEPSGYTSLLANTDNDPEREGVIFAAL